MEKRRFKILVIISMMLVFYIKTFSVTIFNTANHIVVIYKILDPLSVTVDSIEKLTVSAGHMESFKYSKTSMSKKPVNIRVERPYNHRDNILDAVFNEATLEIQNQGVFELKQTTDNTKVIKAKGFFVDNSSHRITIPLTSGGAANKYQGNTNLDVEFNNTKEKIELGTYKGVLRVDVLYGG